MAELSGHIWNMVRKKNLKSCVGRSMRVEKRKEKKYKYLDFAWIPLKIMPLYVALLTVFTVICSLLPAYQTLAVSGFVDTVLRIFNGERAYNSIYLPIMQILVYMICINIMPSIRQLLDIKGRNRLSLFIKQEVAAKEERLEYGYLENSETRDLIHRVCPEAAENFWKGFHNIFDGIQLMINVVSLLAIIMSAAFWPGVAILAVSVPLFWAALRLGRTNYTLDREVKKLRRRYQYLHNVMTKREYASERFLFQYSGMLSQRYEKLFDQANRIETKTDIRRYRNMKSGSLVTLLLVCLICLILLPSLRSGKMSIGLFMAVVGAGFSLIQSMSWRLSETMYQYANGKEYLKDFSAFMHLEEKKDACARRKRMKDFVLEELEFQNVGFRYPGTEEDILKDCSFRLEGTKRYALVGRNGAGKSTIVKLIAGMYDTYEGRILVNGRDIRSYPFAERKGMAAVLFQDFSRYETSVRENITLGYEGKDTEERINGILKKLDLDEMVKELPFGLDTPLGRLEEGAVELSGGEWQKLALARLMYADAPVNLLDEPASALDPVAESKLYRLFASANAGRFCIYITHRLGAARIADEILVIADSHVSEQGTHEDLMERKNGIYRAMFEEQKQWYE
ncbi:MAG TPA: ABC transporter ATP-binding protein/permease [Candidatus Eisenbergiella merdipullorum]|uniref:ABC transporter ATP-binding protein/permease n=1 Tax=Candidatus Eisenbergiella merdipullorum TaxID=2838553 RepID=A0A9D2I7W7_9FIRM|nr:ABC transporter ATP-binding protein/permease [Candidatus Eisenbergiella merdipullorum]